MGIYMFLNDWWNLQKLSKHEELLIMLAKDHHFDEC